jgi:AcrR family transcriptional regulator
MVAKRTSDGGTAVERLLDAVETLCETGSPSDVTMRQIAAEAGVSVGLAYHHFDSRIDLFGATLARIGSSFAASASVPTEPADVVHALLAAMDERPAFTRIVSWSILRGEDVGAAMGKHPLVAMIAARGAADGHERPQDLAAMLAIIGLGVSFFGPAVERATGTDPTTSTVIEQFARAFDLESRRTSMGRRDTS